MEPLCALTAPYLCVSHETKIGTIYKLPKAPILPSNSTNIRFDSSFFRDSDQTHVLQREWLLTNGIGGYSSSTIAGTNTRRYHGLLVAALSPPVGRAVLLSKLEESLEIVEADGSRSPTYSLATNHYPGVTYPHGFDVLQSWESQPVPTTVWSPAADVLFQKRVWMAEEQNTVYVAYTLLETPANVTAHLHLAPLVAWTDYHTEMHSTNASPHVDWYSPDQVVSREPNAPTGTLRIFLDYIVNQSNGKHLLELAVTDMSGNPTEAATFAGQPCWNYSMIHVRELERGQDCREDLFGPGMISFPMAAGETVVITCSVSDRGGQSEECVANRTPQVAYDAVIKKQSTSSASTEIFDPFRAKLEVAADQFLIHGSDCRSTIIAGYHWFADWGRDTMISLPGLCLRDGKGEAALNILTSYAQYVNAGMLPNRFPDGGTSPEYNTVDATLWYFAAIYRYYKFSGDLEAIRTIFWQVLESIISAHLHGTRYGIHVDTDSLLYAGAPGVQLTWMDAKIGEWVVTPRTGKPVEINALWQNALCTMAEFARLLNKPDSADRYDLLAQTHAGIFRARFSRSDGFGLYDVVDTPPQGAPDESVRPNQIFAISLPFPVLDPTSAAARNVVRIVQDQLYTPVGLRTLSPMDSRYRPNYAGSSTERDSAYHMGTVWPWLLGPFAEAHFKVFGDVQEAKKLLGGLESQLSVYGIGSLSEVYDGGALDAVYGTQKPGGCIAQAWSVGETLRVWTDLTDYQINNTNHMGDRIERN